MEDTGYPVTEAAEGEQAGDTLRTSTARLVVVLDQDLPRLDSIGMLRTAADDGMPWPIPASCRYQLQVSVGTATCGADLDEARPQQSNGRAP